MTTALIGYTGFVGSNLLAQTTFTDLYNSKNINEIKGKNYDLIISVGNSSVMWKANKEPQVDLQNIRAFMDVIQEVKAKRFVLMSTLEVYDNPVNVNEDSPTHEDNLKPYGLHRFQLEKFIGKTFAKHTIIRMPNLYGSHLRKNFVFDLIHNNRFDLTHKDNMQQWYNLQHLWKDIQIAMHHDIPLINFAVEPISCHELAKYTLDINFTTITDAPPRIYDMKTKYGKLFQSKTPYLYQKEESLKELRAFMLKERSQL